MYKAQQAETEAAAGADTGASGPEAEEPASEEDVVDAEFSEVDDENKSSS
jgi:molecular chaperone DnaK